MVGVEKHLRRAVRSARPRVDRRMGAVHLEESDIPEPRVPEPSAGGLG